MPEPRIDILASIGYLDFEPGSNWDERTIRRIADAIDEEDEADEIEAEVAERVRVKFVHLVDEHNRLVSAYDSVRADNGKLRRALRWSVLVIAALVVAVVGILAGSKL